MTIISIQRVKVKKEKEVKECCMDIMVIMFFHRHGHFSGSIHNKKVTLNIYMKAIIRYFLYIFHHTFTLECMMKNIIYP